MREVVLDGTCMHTKAEMHDELIEKLGLPYYYGRSLDSLWTILQKEDDPVHILVKNPSNIAIGYGEVLLELFGDLVKQNKNFTVDVE